MRRVIELSVEDRDGHKIEVRAVIDGVNYMNNMIRLEDELTSRLMIALTDLPVLQVKLGRIRVK